MSRSPLAIDFALPAGEVAHRLIGATVLVGLADTQIIHPRCSAAATVS